MSVAAGTRRGRHLRFAFLNLRPRSAPPVTSNGQIECAKRESREARPKAGKMKIVIFGLTISSSWGNGHATVWRSLCRQLIGRGHTIVFFERDVPYYAAHRDVSAIVGGKLRLYESWDDIVDVAGRELRDADVAIVTSYCPDAVAASDLIWFSPAVRVFYDLDAPVTIARLRAGEVVPYIPPNGLGDFDLVLSFTGGAGT